MQKIDKHSSPKTGHKTVSGFLLLVQSCYRQLIMIIACLVNGQASNNFQAKLSHQKNQENEVRWCLSSSFVLRALFLFRSVNSPAR